MSEYSPTHTLEEVADFHAHSSVVAFQVSDERWRRLRNAQSVTVPSTGRVIPIRGGGDSDAIKPIYPTKEAGRFPGSLRPDPATGTDAGGCMAAGGDA